MQTITSDKIALFKKYIQDSSCVSVVVHTHPDGDAMGSSMALASVLKRMGVASVKVIAPDEWGAGLDFIVDKSLVINASQSAEEAQSWIAGSDLLICEDLSDLSRSGAAEQWLRASSAPRVLIDHHLSPDLGSFDLVFSETEISSTCELLYFVLQAFGDVDLTIEEGTALFVGMTTDTNNFANSVHPSTLEMASGLLKIGVDRDAVLLEIYNRFRENRFRAMSYYLGDAMHITDTGLAYVVFDKATLEKYDLQDGETEGFVNLPLGMEKVNYSVFLKEDKGYFRVSIRSKKGHSANQLAKQFFNGGGHECAAGGRLYFPENIENPTFASSYIENAAARFLQGDPAEDVK